jgi:lipopolysaccharide transport system permease protein
MTETVYTADPELRHVSRFAAAAARDLRQSPAVAWRLVRSGVQARHRRAWLGYLWLLLPTVGTTVVWSYVQSRRIVNIPAGTVPYPVYVLTGTILWQLFVDALNAPLQQLTASRALITRSRLPHEALILAGLIETLFNCAVRLIVLAPVLFFFHVPVGAAVALLPAGIASLALLGLALGMTVAPLGLLYDDVGRGLALLTGLWFFLTPILYPARGVMRWNPVTPLIDATRGWLIGGGADSRFLLVFALTIPLLLAAWLFIRLARPHVVARLG